MRLRLGPLLGLAFLAGCVASADFRRLTSIQPLSTDEWSRVEVADHREADRLGILVFGDAGVGDEAQYAVGRSMAEMCDSGRLPRCDLGLFLGDLIYYEGVEGPDDPRFEAQFEAPFRPLGRIDLWLTPGNHDWSREWSVRDQIRYTLLSDRWRMPFYHYDVPNLPDWLHIYSVDTNILVESLDDDREGGRLERIAAGMLDDARTALCGQPGWRILFAHHPLYTSGRRRGSDGVVDDIEDVLRPVLDECDIQLFLAGHEHHQEFVHTRRIIQVVQGAGGADLRPVGFGDPDFEGARWAWSLHGYAHFDVTEDRIEIRFLAPQDFGLPIELCRWTVYPDRRIGVSETCSPGG